MAIKTTLPAFWDRATGGLYPESAVRLRMRQLSEAKLLPSYREPLTDLHKARFLIGLYASVSHVGAIDSAKRVAGLDNPVHELGTDLAWGLLRLQGRFEDVLARIIQHIGADHREDPYQPDRGWELLELSIASNRPEASIAMNTGVSDSTDADESYRWSQGAVRARFRRGFLDTRAIPGSAVRALALIDFARDSPGPQNGNGDPTGFKDVPKKLLHRPTEAEARAGS